MARAILGGQLVDGTGRDPIDNGVVVVDQGRIAAVGRADAIHIPADAEIYDAAGGNILPGFIDCHVHSTYRARDVKQHLLNPATYNIFRSLPILSDTLACGITTARDMGGADAGFREAVAEGIIAGPRLQISIAMLCQSGGHGDSYVPAGFHVPRRSWLPHHIADGVEEVRKVARSLLMAGADFLKICTTGGITSVTDGFDETQFSVEEIRVVVAEAMARKRGVAVHAEGCEGIKNALRAGGVHSIEHGWLFDEECLDMMLAQGTWWVPTLALVPEGARRRAVDAEWSGQELAKEASAENEICERLRAQIPLYNLAREKGLRIAMGTDQSHRLLTGENLIELGYMVEYLGMSPMEAIVASTATAAECVGRPDLGVLAEGKTADVVVFDGDPLADIQALGDASAVRLVMKAGDICKDTLAAPA